MKLNGAGCETDRSADAAARRGRSRGLKRPPALRRGPPPDPAPAVPTRARRVLTLAALALALLAAITWLSPLRQYTDLHHAERGRQRDVP